MANHKIYKIDGVIFIEVAGETKKHYQNDIDFDIAGGKVFINAYSAINPGKWNMILNEVQDINGNVIGDLAAVEQYFAELKIGKIDFEPTDYHMEVPLGNVPGQSSINKFGANADITKDTKEDVWDLGTDYPFTANGIAPITHIHSGSTSDTEPIEIQGLDIDGILTTQTITLNGTTLVALTTPLWRVFRLKNIGTSDLIGVVDVANSGDTVIYAQINIGNNQTLMAIYTIPANKTALLTKYYATVVPSTNKDPTSTRFSVWMRDTTINGVFQLKHVVGIPKAGAMVEHAFDPYPKITQLVDIKITALPIGENGDVAAGFDLILIDD